jgi:FkbM family methyltransferase
MSISSKLKAIGELAYLSTRHGPQFPFTRTGKVKAFDYAFPMYCRPSLYYLSESARGRCYEPATCRHMISRFRDKQVTFLDIGAYYGFFSALFGAMNPENVIHAFEPNPEHYKTLEKNWRMNCRKGGTHAIALSDSEGMVPFMGSSMRVTENEAAISVQAIPFDQWRTSTPIQPDVIKLDVHGSEGKVLYGMQQLLKEGGFSLYFELHPEGILADYSLKDVISILYDNGWEMAELPDFRGSNSIEATLLTPEKRAILEDQSKWTQHEYHSRRMFFCEKTG